MERYADMRTPLRVRRSAARAAQQQRAEHAIRDAKVRERLDSPFAVLAGIGLLTLLGGGLFAGFALDRADAFDPQIMRPLPDERILTNLRDSEAPFIGGATLQNGEGAMMLLRKDGQLARFNEATGLVSHVAIDRAGIGLASELTALSAGCGLEKITNSDVACAQPDQLFMLSQDGGLAQSGNGKDWRIRLRDAPWVGKDGTPISQQDVTAWASSDDGRYVAVLAGAQGLALFDQQTDSWITVAGAERLETAQAPVHLLGHRGDFWVGTEQGLGRVAPTGTGTQVEWSTGRAFAVRDLDVTAQGDLVALVEGGCAANIGTGCLSIEAVSGVNKRRILVGEVEKNQTLSDDTIRHAVLQNGKIVVVDQAGIFAYDGQRRTWRTVATGNVDAFWISAQTGEITATLADRLVQVSEGLLRAERDIQGAPFTQIEVTAAGRILGLGRDGQLRDLQSDSVLSSREGAPPDATVFHAGASVGNIVLLASTTGILLHDVAARRFEWRDAAGMGTAEQQLNARGVQLLSAEGTVWMVNPATGVVATVGLTGKVPDIDITLSETAVLARPLKSVTPSPTGLFVTDAAGLPFQLTKSVLPEAAPRVRAPVGPPRSGSGAFITATEHNTGILFATQTQIWDYDQQDRGWVGPFAAPPQARIADISLSNDLFLLSKAGRVYRNDDEGWAPIVGAGPPARLGSADVTDAIASGSRLYFGGRGVVQTYDLDASRFGSVFEGGQGAVSILSLNATRPIWMSNGALRYGDNVMTDTPVIGAWAASDGIVALAQGQANTRYSMHWRSPTERPECTFRSAAAPTGQNIDAVKISEGRILVVTASGAAIYVEAERRWLSVRGMTPTADLRVYVTAGQLVAVTDQSIRSMPIANIPVPQSCAEPEVALKWEVGESGLNVAFDGDRGRAVVLKPDGQVMQWARGSLSQLLPAANQGPRLDTSLQSVHLGRSLVLATSNAVWQYDLADRRWARTVIEMPAGSGPVTEVDLAIEPDSSADLTVWTQDGSSFVGSWQAGTARVQVTRITAKGVPPLRTAARDILDISMVQADWLIGSAAGIEITRASARQPKGTINFPKDAGVSATPKTLGGNTVFTVGDSAALQRLFVLPKGSDIAKLQGALTALAYDYTPGSDRTWALDDASNSLWRIDNAGAVWSCDISSGQRAPQGCAPRLAAPLTVEAGNVGAVFESARDLYAVISGGLAHFDASRRTRAPIAGPRPQNDVVAVVVGGEILLWEGPGGTLWRIKDKTAQDVLPNVIRMADEKGDLIFATPEGLYRMPTSGAERGNAVNLSDKTALRAVSYDWRQGGTVIGLDAFGNVRSENGDLAFPLKVPEPDTITYLDVLAKDEIWVQREGGAVAGYAVSQCVLQRNPHGGLGRCVIDIEGSGFANLSGETLLSVGNAVTRTLSFETYEVSFDGTAFGSERAALLATDLPSKLRDRRADFVAQIRPNAAGQSELAPATLRAGGTEVENGVGGTLARVARGMTPFQPLSLGWLNWDRTASGFSLDAFGGARVVLTPDQFIRNGRMLLDHDGVARGVTGADDLEWVTPHSIWRLTGPRADPVLYRLSDLPNPVGLEAGRLLFDAGRGLAQDSQTVDRDQDRARITVGALKIESNWRAQTSQGQIMRDDGTMASAFASAGFAHDIRARVGWSAQGAVLSTLAGVVPTGDFRSVLPRPASGTPARILHSNGQTLALNGGVWSGYDPALNSWSSVADPFARRVLADMDGVVWAMDQNRFSITATDPADQWRVARDGLRFKADQLRALSATPQALVVGTGLGTHQFAGAGTMAQGSDADDVTLPDTTFDALATKPNDWVLFAGNGAYLWDTRTRKWTAPDATAAPWAARRAIQISDIQFDILAQGQTRARRKVRQRGGSERFASFEWDRGGYMPFDRANAIYAEGADLYVGTDAGLRMMGRAASRSDVFVDGRAGSVSDARAVAPVTRIGRGQSDPARLLARDRAGACIEIGTGKALSACSDPATLDRLFVKSDDLWRWSKREGGISGAYILTGSADVALSNNPTSRWPHDRLGIYAACEGRTVEVWLDGTTLREGGTTQNLGGSKRVAALCQTDLAEIAPNVRLAQGLYLISGAGDVPLVQTGPLTWSQVDPVLTAPIEERALGLWAFDAGRLRIQGQGPVRNIYQYRPQASGWATMAWGAGLPVMDQTNAVLSDGARVLRATPMGMITQGLTGQALTVDPDTVVFRTTAAPEAFASCVPDRAARLDGRSHTIDRQTGAPVVLRCLDGRIIQEDPNQRSDVGSFALADNSPFENRMAIDETGGWRWALDDARPGSDPVVTVAYRQERVSLAAGRFDLDDYRSLAAPFANQISVVAGLGVWDYPNLNLALNAALRPEQVPDHARVTAVTSDRDQNMGNAVLCTDRRDAAPVVYTKEGTPRQVEACYEWRGQDALFQYRHQDTQGVQALGLAANGPLVARTIAAGQFTDRVAVGMPMPLNEAGDLLVATPVGASVLGPDGQARTIYSHADMAGVAILPRVGAAILTQSGVYPLSQEAPQCPSLATALGQIPTDHSVRSIILSGGARVHLHGDSPTGRFATTVRCGEGTLTDFSQQFEVEERTRHVALMRAMPEATSTVQITQARDGSLVLSDGRSRQLPLEGAVGELIGVFGATQPRAVVVLTQQDAYLVDVDAALSALGQAPVTVAPPAVDPVAEPVEPLPERQPKEVQTPDPQLTAPAKQPVPSPAAPKVQEVAPVAPVAPQVAPTPAPQEVLNVPYSIASDGEILIDLGSAKAADVIVVQLRLQVLGHYSGGIDGDVGPLTRRAITAFQSKTGAEQTGKLTLAQYLQLVK